MNMNERTAIWALTEIRGLGAAGIKKLIEEFGTGVGVFEAFAGKEYGCKTVSEKLGDLLAADRDWKATESRMKKSIPPGAEMTVISEQRYPSRLRNIPDPPPVLYFKGNPELLNGPALAIVGSRKPSDYGLRITARIAEELGAAGVLIVSGLAFGIDARAHEAALDAKGISAAVFGCAIDNVYPAAHRSLADKIAGSGCLLSEFPRGVRPERFNFPVRNRIISGISDGVLVVEAGGKSGALITAELALDQGREVLAVPGSVDSALSAGPNRLIKQGASPVTEVEDVLELFGWHKSEKAAAQRVDLSKLSADELRIYSQLSIQPTHLDDLGRRTDLSPSRTAELLLNLEIKGFILRKPGNFVVKA